MATELLDQWSVPVATGDLAALDSFNAAVEGLLSLSGDPEARAKEAVARAPEFALARIFLAYLGLYASTSQGNAAANAALAGLDLQAGALGERERIHVRAAHQWAAGELEAATIAWEEALRLNPRDLLALKLAQDVYFFLGDQRNLRDSPARVLGAWRKGDSGWGYLQGIYAFGLEESGAYGQAEERAHAALAVNSGDVWAVHAAAHVFEMQGRQEEGVAFLGRTAKDWQESYFAVHNWWHHGLFHIELCDFDAVLDLYDNRIRLNRSDVWLDLVDAASLLWRLSLYGIDLGERPNELASTLEALSRDTNYIFNDWHRVMVNGLTGRHDLSEVVLKNQENAWGTNRRVGSTVGVALLEAFDSFAFGEFERSTSLLFSLRPRAHALGGSHAQRDVIDLTLLAAASAAGDAPLVRALVSERDSRKPTASTSTKLLVHANSTT